MTRVDLRIKNDPELGVAEIAGETDEGAAFVDEYNPIGVEFSVADAGRIIVPAETVLAALALAGERGLTWEMER